MFGWLLFSLQAGWCDSQGTADDVRSKIHMRHEGAIKRERALTYAQSHQVHNAGLQHTNLCIEHLNLFSSEIP